jgi:hypothetical protein
MRNQRATAAEIAEALGIEQPKDLERGIKKLTKLVSRSDYISSTLHVLCGKLETSQGRCRLTGGTFVVILSLSREEHPTWIPTIRDRAFRRH